MLNLTYKVTKPLSLQSYYLFASCNNKVKQQTYILSIKISTRKRNFLSNDKL